MKKILILVLILALGPLARAQQGQTFTWSSTKCSDGTAIPWPGCQSHIVPSGSYYSEAVPGLFAEEIDGRTANVGVTVTKINTDFIIHVGFQAALPEGSFTVRPQDAVWIESDSSIHTTIGATPYPDPEIQARKDADVMKQRFRDKAPITVSGPQWTFGYLFFPYDNRASRITIVVQAGNETFRFPLAKNPNANEWLDPDKVPVASPVASASAPAPAPAPDTMPTPPAPCAAQQPSEVPLTVISFAIADRGGVHAGVMAWTRNWVDKNAKKFPEVAFQDCPVQGAKNYLIVFSASTSVLYGFEPVVRTSTSTSTSPVSGSGTFTDSYGYTWDFTYNGDVTTTTTTTTHENVPYTIQSNTLYATAYDEHGVIVSRRWHVFNTKQGGDAANSLGYNLASALFAANSRGRLLNAVVKDIARKKKK